MQGLVGGGEGFYSEGGESPGGLWAEERWGLSQLSWEPSGVNGREHRKRQGPGQQRAMGLNQVEAGLGRNGWILGPF